MRWFSILAVAAVVVIAGLLGSVVGVVAILDQVAVALSLAVAAIIVALAVAAGARGAFRTRTPYW